MFQVVTRDGWTSLAKTKLTIAGVAKWSLCGTNAPMPYRIFVGLRRYKDLQTVGVRNASTPS